MRVKDEKKREAICAAAIKSINELGFHGASVSKIAKEANVSSSTLYVYFKDKDDLLNQTYLEVKEKMAKHLSKGISKEASFEQTFRQLWQNFHEYMNEYTDEFFFGEQFHNSPLIYQLQKEKVRGFFEPFFEIFEQARKDKILKDFPADLLAIYSFQPILQLFKWHHSGEIKMDKVRYDQALELAWEAVKR